MKSGTLSDVTALQPYVDLDRGRLELAVQSPPVEDLAHVDGLLAGVAEVDLTPPPGMPKSGHSLHARTGVGFRTRLRARVLHLRAGSSSIALVATDLLAGSSIVHHLVAQEVASDTDVRLPGLFLGATHTHAGPGQHSGSEFMNRHAANKSGFDPAYTDFLVRRISGAVREAVAGRVPARLAFGSTEVWGFTRNRSLPAYVANDNVSDKRTQTQRKYAAINPWLHLLRVDDADGPLGAFLWFSIHGTGISPHDDSYNADVWAYITGTLAAAVEQESGRRPVVGAVEGTHGDMTPAVRPGMLVFPEAERIGRGIGAAAADLHARLAGRLTDRVELACGIREIDMGARPEVDGITLPDPAIGLAKLGGAQENTAWNIDKLPLFRPGQPGPDRGPHGVKRVAFGRAHGRLVSPTKDYPLVLPFQVLRIGTAAVVGVPFEVTVEAGRRLADAAAAVLPGDATVVVSSLANEHCDYLTTPEEYSQQWYEGASTVFGPRQGEFCAGVVRRLASDVEKESVVAQLLPVRRFDLTVRRFLPRPTNGAGPRRCRPARFVEATAESDAYWEMPYDDAPPGDLHWHEPMLRVEREQDDGGWVTVADDQGWYVGVVVDRGERGLSTGRFLARWYAPAFGARHRFVLIANNGRPEVAGPPFD